MSTHRERPPPDALQKAVIARVAELGITPAQLNERSGLDNLDHLERFLTCRAPMLSHKVAKLFAALGLGVVVRE